MIEGKSNPFKSVIKESARSFAKEYLKNEGTESTSEHFNQTAQESFNSNERGSEDLMDMYEKGAFE